jgi:hypothetical protein
MNEAQRLNKSIARKPQEAMGERSIGYALNWAWRIRFIPMNLKMPLLAMASQANAAGVFEGQVTWLAGHCNCEVRHMQKIILTLRDLGLIVVVDMNPGTINRARLFALQITVDPDLWEPPQTEELPLIRRPGVVALNNQAFHDDLSKSLESNPQLATLYRMNLINVRVLDIAAARGPNARLRLRVPHKDASDAIYVHFEAAILETASKLSGVTVKKIQVIHASRRFR